MQRILPTLLFICFFSISFGQNDSLIKSNSNESWSTKYDPEPKKRNYFDIAWVPVGLSILSIELMRDSAKYGLQDLIRSPVSDTFHTSLDDYIQYAPIAIMYLADLTNIPRQNSAWNQTKFLIISEILTAAIVWPLKLGLKIQRPNNGAFTAYPSGHTSQAFVTSQVLYNEYRDYNKFIAFSGFLFSIPTGALRILNNKHWLPDVLLGAGIAMLVTNSVYYFRPLQNWNPWKKRNKKIDVGFIPSIREDYFGGHLTLKF